MFRSDAQLARACRALCSRAGLGRLWTATGPTDEAIEIFEANGGPLSSGERVMLLAAWAFWNSAEKVTLADVVLPSRRQEPAGRGVSDARRRPGRPQDRAVDRRDGGQLPAVTGPCELHLDHPVRRPALRAGRLSLDHHGSVVAALAGEARPVQRRSSPERPCHGPCTCARAAISSRATSTPLCSLREQGPRHFIRESRRSSARGQHHGGEVGSGEPHKQSVEADGRRRPPLNAVSYAGLG